VLLVEDIVDTGLPSAPIANAGRRRPTRFRCALFWTATRAHRAMPVNYRCFEIPDRFVVGFGLDYNSFIETWGTWPS